MQLVFVIINLCLSSRVNYKIITCKLQNNNVLFHLSPSFSISSFRFSFPPSLPPSLLPQSLPAAKSPLERATP